MFPIFGSNLSSKHQTLVLLKRGFQAVLRWALAPGRTGPLLISHRLHLPTPPFNPLPLVELYCWLFTSSPSSTTKPSHIAKLTMPFPPLSANACHQLHHYFNFTNFTTVHPQPCLSIPCPLPPATSDPPRAREEGGCAAGCPSPWGAIPARPRSLPWRPGLAVPLWLCSCHFSVLSAYHEAARVASADVLLHWEHYISAAPDYTRRWPAPCHRCATRHLTATLGSCRSPAELSTVTIFQEHHFANISGIPPKSARIFLRFACL